MDKISEALTLIGSMDKELLQIIAVTMKMSFFSTLISCLIGMPLGAASAMKNYPGKRIVNRLSHTLMSLPPVVAGLVVYLLFTRKGPFGSLGLLFSLPVMVIAQCVLIIPVVFCMTGAQISGSYSLLNETAIGLSLTRGKKLRLAIHENRRTLVSVVLTAFGRSIAEVGAVTLVGGNIQWKTRVMTTAIMLETNKGNFSFALALGMILLVIALVVNIAASFIVREESGHD